MTNNRLSFPHITDFEIFRESLSYSEAATGFTASLIEKDYYCSLVLRYIFKNKTTLVFKGGTCLSKVHIDFYRLSEDLDFVIPVSDHTNKSGRRHKIKPIRSMIDRLPETIPGIKITSALSGHNQSRQYIGSLQYRSAILDKTENIKIEIGLREPLIKSSESKAVHTIAVNPFNRLPLLPEFDARVMNMEEAFAEKVRAAMTRREPAIRDFFDLYQAVNKKKINPLNPDFLDMVKAKLIVPGNEVINLSLERKHELDRQLKAQLKPVLRSSDFTGFNLNEAYQMVCEIATAIQ